jgi:hypothetical protein
MTRKSQCLIFSLSLSLGGCGTQLALSGKAREDYLKSIKAYGEYFVKQGASQDDWRRDWVVCGGTADGGFSSDAPSGSPTDVLINASKQKRKSLAACMKSKGYEHQKGFEFGKTDS